MFTKPGEAFPAEDPFIWRGADRFWAVVKDFKGHSFNVAIPLRPAGELK